MFNVGEVVHTFGQTTASIGLNNASNKLLLLLNIKIVR